MKCVAGMIGTGLTSHLDAHGPATQNFHILCLMRSDVVSFGMRSASKCPDGAYCMANKRIKYHIKIGLKRLPRNG